MAPDDLRAAWAGLIARARINRHHLVTREQLSVRAEMTRLLRVLTPTRYAEFTSLFAAHADVPHLVVTFLALLELAREQLVAIAQAEPYAPIYVQLTARTGLRARVRRRRGRVAALACIRNPDTMWQWTI